MKTASRCNIDGLLLARHTSPNLGQEDVSEPACSKVEVGNSSHLLTPRCKRTEVSSQEILRTARLRKIDIPVACSPQSALAGGSLWALGSTPPPNFAPVFPIKRAKRFAR